FEFFAVVFDFDRHHFVVSGEEVEFAAIAAPDGVVAAASGDLPLATMLGEGLDVYFKAAGLVGGICQKLAVGGEFGVLFAKLGVDVGERFSPNSTMETDFRAPC